MLSFWELPPGVVLTYAALLGLVFGSFVTALSYRLPRGISISKGRSACPSCKTPLAVRDLIPLASWLANRGACRVCGAKVSWRYPAIEALMAILFVLAVYVVTDHLRLGVILAATPVMMTLAVVDLEQRRLPNPLLGLLAVAAIAFRATTGADFVLALVSAIGVFVFALLLDLAGRRYIRQGLGMGDAKLMTVAALALPPEALLLVLGCAGALGVLAGLVWRGRGAVGAVQVPLGPPILLGLWVAMVGV